MEQTLPSKSNRSGVASYPTGRHIQPKELDIKTFALLTLAALLALPCQAAASDTESSDLFKKKCGICHKLDKKAMGPAIKEMSTDPATLKAVIADGRKAMPSFSNTLDAGQIDALVVFIQSKQNEAEQ